MCPPRHGVYDRRHFLEMFFLFSFSYPVIAGIITRTITPGVAVINLFAGTKKPFISNIYDSVAVFTSFTVELGTIIIRLNHFRRKIRSYVIYMIFH